VKLLMVRRDSEATLGEEGLHLLVCLTPRSSVPRDAR